MNEREAQLKFCRSQLTDIDAEINEHETALLELRLCRERFLKAEQELRSACNGQEIDLKQVDTLSNDRTMTANIETVLKACKAPMKTKEIVATMERAGIKSATATSLSARVNATLNQRKNRFERVGRGTYRLK